MAITGSGQIALIADIEAEFNQEGTTDISLFQARSDAGLPVGEVSMFDFYGLSNAVAPSVTTLSSTSVTTNSMTIRGEVTSDGGGTITERGFYFGTDLYTYNNNTKYTVSGTTGVYTRSMTGLTAGTTYGIWAYATNSAGTTVGSRVMTATSIPSLNITLNVSSYSPTDTCWYWSEIGMTIVGTMNSQTAATTQYLNFSQGYCQSFCSPTSRGTGSSVSINKSATWYIGDTSGMGAIAWSVWAASGYASHSYTHQAYYGPGNGGC